MARKPESTLLDSLGVFQTQTTAEQIVPEKRDSSREELIANQQQQLLFNSIWSARQQWITDPSNVGDIFDTRRNLNKECGFPATISIPQYHAMYEREGVAQRVVSIYPDECWKDDPEIKESEDAEESEFDKILGVLNTKRHLNHYLHRIDESSGIGRYGVLLIGIDDGKPLNEPVDGLEEVIVADMMGEERKDTSLDYKVLYFRALEEQNAIISKSEESENHPRFQLPTEYELNFTTTQNSSGQSIETEKKVKVHWTRIIHVADNCKASELFGIPRQRDVFNYLLNIRKLAASSPEMFYKGGFPGYAFSVKPGLENVVLDKESIREEMTAYMDGMQRYLANEGLDVHSLAPQVADPRGHMDSQIKLICIAKAIPQRIFEGSERGELASSQDTDAWNTRVARRREKYVSPMVIRPVLERLMMLGALPFVEDFLIEWPDLNESSDQEKAESNFKQTETLAKYVQGNVSTMIPEKEFMVHFLDMDEKLVDTILEVAAEAQEGLELEAEHERELMIEDEARRAGLAGGGDVTLPIPPAAPKGGKPAKKKGAKVPGGEKKKHLRKRRNKISMKSLQSPIRG